MDNEERISAAERKAAEEMDQAINRMNSAIALEGAMQHHRGYRAGLYDGLTFVLFLVVASVGIYAWLRPEGGK
jgi:hypothetical protein